ncbi:DUF6134 family protein [Pollutibacter soli]|uniref:DUF6134 family protein n=1 Tax=Pollutibacter soli TaxID=3034157 RepID=UPI0030139FD1
MGYKVKSYRQPKLTSTKFNFIRILFLINILLLSTASISQNKSDGTDLYYDVLKNNTVIGQIHAVKKNNSAATEYIIESNVNLEMMVVDFKIYSIVRAAFSEGQLLQSSLVRKVNGKEKVNLKINRSDDKYILHEASSVKTISEKILYTTACLMSMEPLNIVRIFSENLKQFITVKMVKPHMYELQLPDGNKHTYYYENGICVWAKVSTSISDAMFRLKR